MGKSDNYLELSECWQMFWWAYQLFGCTRRGHTWVIVIRQISPKSSFSVRCLPHGSTAWLYPTLAPVLRTVSVTSSSPTPTNHHKFPYINTSSLHPPSSIMQIKSISLFHASWPSHTLASQCGEFHFGQTNVSWIDFALLPFSSLPLFQRIGFLMWILTTNSQTEASSSKHVLSLCV